MLAFVAKLGEGGESRTKTNIINNIITFQRNFCKKKFARLFNSVHRILLCLAVSNGSRRVTVRVFHPRMLALRAAFRSPIMTMSAASGRGLYLIVCCRCNVPVDILERVTAVAG